MKTTRNLKIISRILLFFGVLFIVVLFADGYSGPFYSNRNYRAFKYLLCIIVPALLTLFNYYQEKTYKYISQCSVVATNSFVVSFLIFNYLEIGRFSFKEMASLYHISYAMICIFALFATATAISYVKRNSQQYESFYKAFFAGYLPMLIMLYYLFYFNYRYSGVEYQINLIPFQGEIKSLLSSPSSLSAMRTIGNIAYYSTISLTASRFVKKHTAFFSFLIPFLLCLLTETAQGLFSIGDADIDDVLLNSIGALIGALIYKFIIEKIRRKCICSE